MWCLSSASGQRQGPSRDSPCTSPLSTPPYHTYPIVLRRCCTLLVPSSRSHQQFALYVCWREHAPNFLLFQHSTPPISTTDHHALVVYPRVAPRTNPIIPWHMCPGRLRHPEINPTIFYPRPVCSVIIAAASVAPSRVHAHSAAMGRHRGGEQTIRSRGSGNVCVHKGRGPPTGEVSEGAFASWVRNLCSHAPRQLCQTISEIEF